MSTAHCMRCETSVTPVNVRRVEYPNKRIAERGQCPTCKTTTHQFVKAGR